MAAIRTKILLSTALLLCAVTANARTSPFISLSSESAPLDVQERFDLIDIDTLFYIDNAGLTRILVNVNDHIFKLTTDSLEAARSANAFVIPEFGPITMGIGSLIFEGDGNFMDVTSQGPPGSDAFLVVGDLLLPGEAIAFFISDLQSIPASFDLLQGYPNPITESATIVFDIPRARTSGVFVRLNVYDSIGRLVARLVEETRFPGRFEVTWHATDDQGARLAAGVYFVHVQAGQFTDTQSMTVVH